MVKTIVHTVQPISVVLFGSYATGTIRDDSDIDFLVVERESFCANRSRWNEIKRLRQALRPFKGSKDILVYSDAEVQQLRTSANHLVGKAFRQGKVLYES